jgi:hypothetical protein
MAEKRSPWPPNGIRWTKGHKFGFPSPSCRRQSEQRPLYLERGLSRPEQPLSSPAGFSHCSWIGPMSLRSASSSDFAKSDVQ